jgi:predicted nucleic acid-binding protein
MIMRIKMDYGVVEEQLNSDVFLISEKSIKTYNKGKLLILDTSVIVKWFFKDGERNKEKADIILNQYMENKIGIVIPELSVFEVANVLKNKIKKYKSQQQDIIDRLYKMGIIFYIDKEILKNAVNIAIDINESVYDCIFLATAEYFGGMFVTDDKRLFSSYKNYKKKKIQVSILKDYIC